METSYVIPNLENQKNDVGSCSKPFFTTLRPESIIHAFKVDSLRKFHSSMWLEDMNPRNLSTVQRERKILEIMQIFCEENNFDDPVHLCNFAAKFANYDETAFIFEPQLQLTIL